MPPLLPYPFFTYSQEPETVSLKDYQDGKRITFNINKIIQIFQYPDRNHYKYTVYFSDNDSLDLTEEQYNLLIDFIIQHKEDLKYD